MGIRPPGNYFITMFSLTSNKKATNMSVDIHKGIQDGMRRNAYKSDDLGAFFKVRSPLPLFDNHNTSKSNILKFKILISK